VNGHALRTLTLICLLSGLSAPNPARAQGRAARADMSGAGADARLAQLIHANVVATHAHQVLLAKKAGKGDAACYGAGGLSDEALSALVARQSSLLKSDVAAIKAWVRGGKSGFDPAKDLAPLLTSGLAVPAAAPVNAAAEHLGANTKAKAEQRAVASLYQTALEIERDGDLLQEQFKFYIALGLPVYHGQLGLPGGDGSMLKIGRALEGRACASPYATDAAAWQIAGRKIWNWGEKHLGVRDDKALAAELLRERGVRALLPRVRALPAQRVAVVGHSFTMHQHWSSPSSFVPVVTDIFRRVNPRVEFRQFERGGLRASAAKQRFYQGALDWKPDKVLLVVLTRTQEDYAALREMGEGFAAAGVEALVFDDLRIPESINPGDPVRAARVAREAGITVIEVGDALRASPERERFLSLDRVHMTEPYHRLMAKEWLKFLARAGGGRRGR
jgi:hypothetical protein